jgi:hypothetical protein
MQKGLRRRRYGSRGVANPDHSVRYKFRNSKISIKNQVDWDNEMTPILSQITTAHSIRFSFDMISVFPGFLGLAYVWEYDCNSLFEKFIFNLLS